MCGISGIIGENIQEEKLTLLNSHLKHRGPDATHQWISERKTIGLAHQRLSILDLSELATQPMHSADKNYVIVFNGEIFNFIEIREELISKGYSFKTESDTEVILAAYDCWQEEMLNKFNGMWAFVLADLKRDLVFLARDRFGIKPFYYIQNDGTFIFASEVQAIHKYLGKKWPLNKKVIYSLMYGSFDHHGTAETYLEQVYSLPSGHCALLDQNKLRIKKWYTLPRQDVPKSRKEQTQILKQLITDACKLRLRSDVPIGTCLSGGVDSTTITAFIQNINESDRFSNFSHRSFNLAFPKAEIDESEAALQFTKQLNGHLDLVKLENVDPQKLENVMKKMDGPMHSLAFYPIYLLYEYIQSQQIKVTLDGQGPDEMLGGYRPVFEAMRTASALADPIWFYDIMRIYSSQGEFKYGSARRYVKLEFRRFLQYKYVQYKQALKKPVKILLSAVGLYNHRPLSSSKSVNSLHSFPSHIYLPIDKEFFNEFFMAPLPGILHQFDRCSMANGVECRMPFMDYRIVEFIFSLHPRSKIGGGYTKRILRDAIQGVVPDSIRLNKTKIGFNAPMIEWFRGSLKYWLIELSNSNEFLNNPYFDGKEIQIKLQSFLNTNTPTWEDAWKLWPYFHLAWWLKYVQSWDN